MLAISQEIDLFFILKRNIRRKIFFNKSNVAYYVQQKADQLKMKEFFFVEKIIIDRKNAYDLLIKAEMLQKRVTKRKKNIKITFFIR